MSITITPHNHYKTKGVVAKLFMADSTEQGEGGGKVISTWAGEQEDERMEVEQDS